MLLLFVSPFYSISFVRIYSFCTHRTQNTRCVFFAKILLHPCPKWKCFMMACRRIITNFLCRFKASSLRCQGVPLTDFSSCCRELHTAAAFVQLTPSDKKKWRHRTHLEPAHVDGFLQAAVISSDYLHLSAGTELPFQLVCTLLLINMQCPSNRHPDRRLTCQAELCIHITLPGHSAAWL